MEQLLLQCITAGWSGRVSSGTTSAYIAVDISCMTLQDLIHNQLRTGVYLKQLINSMDLINPQTVTPSEIHTQLNAQTNASN